MPPEEPDYDAAATEEADLPADEEGELDTIFLDHAMAAGLDETQAAELKKAIERCVELKEMGSYEAPLDMEMGEDTEV